MHHLLGWINLEPHSSQLTMWVTRFRYHMCRYSPNPPLWGCQLMPSPRFPLQPTTQQSEAKDPTRVVPTTSTA